MKYAEMKDKKRKYNHPTTQQLVKKIVKAEISKAAETKCLFDTIGADGDGVTDQSRALTCFRAARGDRMFERIGVEVIPVGIRIDYHLASRGVFQTRIKIAVVELKGTRAVNSGNAGSYLLDNLFQAENSPASIPVDSTSLLQCERLTTPLNTELMNVLAIRSFDIGKNNNESANPPYSTGSFYVPIKDQTPIRYDSTLASRPGDPDVSRNICVLMWGANPSPGAIVGFGSYISRVNVRQYFKDA